MPRAEYICVEKPTLQGPAEECARISGDGNILKILDRPQPPLGARTLDYRGRGLVALPGLIDIHVHLRDFKQSYKETVRTGTMAALRGGLTLLAEMPNTKPPLNTAETVRRRIDLLRAEAAVPVLVIAGIPRRPGEAERIARIPGVAAFKVYPGDLERERMIREAASTGLPLVLHPELPSADAVDLERENLERRTAARSCHIEAAAVGVLRDLAGPDARIHVTHASCPSTIREARRRGATVDVAPHHLIYTARNPPNGDECYGKVNPPLRTGEESSLLLLALLEGHVDAIASDHAPHAPWEKREPRACASGIPWLELWPWAVARLLRGAGKWRSLSMLAELASRGPARVLGIPARGGPGGEATYTLVEPVEWRFTGFAWSKAPRDYHFMLPLYGRPAGLVLGGSPVRAGMPYTLF